MSIKVKGAGITIGGIATFILLNRAMNHLSGMVHDISEASKWRGYYKHGGDGRMVPPGYSRQSYKDPDTDENIVCKSPDAVKKDDQIAAQEARKPIDMKPIGDSIERVAKAYFKTKGVDLDISETSKWRGYQSYKDLYKTKATEETEKSEDIFETEIDEEKPSIEESVKEVFGDTDGDEELVNKENPDGVVVDIPVREDEEE